MRNKLLILIIIILSSINSFSGWAKYRDKIINSVKKSTRNSQENNYYNNYEDDLNNRTYIEQMEKSRKEELRRLEVEKNLRIAEITNLLCRRDDIIVDNQFAWSCHTGEIKRYNLVEYDEEGYGFQVEELDGVNLYDEDEPRVVRINNSLEEYIETGYVENYNYD